MTTTFTEDVYSQTERNASDVQVGDLVYLPVCGREPAWLRVVHSADGAVIVRLWIPKSGWDVERVSRETYAVARAGRPGF